MFRFVQKLAYYPHKLNAFCKSNYAKTLSTVIFYPSTEICNQNCIFCDSKFYDLKKLEFNRDQMIHMLDDMVQLGADSLIILGDGSEPVLFRDLDWLVEEAVSRNIACGIYTNGSRCDQKLVDCLNKMEFVRVSLDAGNSETHSIIHGYPQQRGDFANALTLLQRINKKQVNTGVAFIILEENVGEIFLTWQMLCDMGVHYIELKLPLQEGYQFSRIKPAFIERIKAEIRKIQSECKKSESEYTEVVLNNHIKEMLLNGCSAELLTRKEEKTCLTCCFRTIISPMGYYLCSPLKNLDNACFGDPFTTGLKEAWESELHMNMIGSPCSICCTYNDQNEVLLQIREGKIFSDFDNELNSQKHFL